MKRVAKIAAASIIENPRNMCNNLDILLKYFEKLLVSFFGTYHFELEKF